ncbi:ATP-grasp domain-containing protein [Terriglobus saanensis]|uniref:Glutathione synthase/ribosomal protein S6 modification glutaminyl transferase-like protein n=1 Tax=Terriglobus saanensis (strain ATCC BAA-1853 / DSM 23119 / SP1PR4) TaxID=401053 RepID=E8V8G5_TERSS|nr:hypothetical protein [Terriglobus saanensis]ADV82944.1 glutathione synthase/ribosomal protein S6 modification glutaminyl transferase-like protein [Terriglobus saanensis SP1PR4]
MKKIGVMFGMENTFPGALVEKINSFGYDGISAEFVTIDVVKMAEPSGYDVIVDRISHDIPFYRSYLKNAALSGTQIINNPFWWSADDKFFNYALATKLGVAVPRTVILPSKVMPPDTNDRSFRNVAYPYDWEKSFEYVGFPAFLKPHNGGGWRDVSHVHNREEFFAAYDRSRDLCMTLQAEVNFKEYFRCYVVGQREVRIMPYDPKRPEAERYVMELHTYDPELLVRIERDALTLCQALGYDLNTVEFAVQDGVPYAIDFMNPAPDADLHSIGRESFDWIVNAVAKLAIEKAQTPGRALPEMRWSAFLSGQSALSVTVTPVPKPPAKKAVAKAAVKAATKTVAAKTTGKKSAARVPGKKAPTRVAKPTPPRSGS